jgi:poly(A) polymerase
MEKKKRKRIIRQNQVILSTKPARNKIIIEEPLLKEIGEIADKNNIEIYVVGGFVRDYYLDRKRTDFDITVVGDSLDFAQKVAKHFKSKAVIFKQFRTAMVPVGEFQIEFVGTRKEEYSEDSRNPVVTEGTLEDDIKRRDFTINSLAASLNKQTKGNVVDLFNGIQDIEKKIIRTPLDPKVTYKDDPLRMMRAARFAAQLDFRIDRTSMNAIMEMSDRIEIISQERITTEFLKIINSDNPGKGIHALFSSGLLQHIFPELHEMYGVENVQIGEKIHSHKDILFHSIKVLDNIVPHTNNTWLRLASLLHDIAKPKTRRFSSKTGYTFHGHEEIGARWMKKVFRKMKLPLEHLPYVEKLVRLHARPMALVDSEVTDSAVRRLAVQAGDALEDLFTLVRADITTKNPNLTQRYKDNYEKVFQKVIDVQERDKLREFQSPVRGEEIMDICNLPPCRAVGFIYNFLVVIAIINYLILN